MLASFLCLDGAPLKRVLLLNSYHQGYAWTDDIVRGVTDGLLTEASPVDIDIEYRDSKRYEDTASEYAFALFLSSKFAHTHFDVIVASDDPVVRFLLKFRHRIFGEIPVVFCGVNEYHGSSSYITANSASRPWLAGVLERIDLDQTVDVALELLPGTRSVVTIGEMRSDRYAVQLKALHPNLSIQTIPVRELSLEKVGAQLSALPPDAIVLLSAFSRDGEGHYLSMKQSVTFVCDHSSVPVFGVNKNALGWGIVGGKLNDGYEQGRAAGEMAASVLQGVPPSAIGIRYEDPNPYEFGWRQLMRWAIPLSKLPAGSIIVNRPKSFYALHPIWVWTALAFIVCQSAAIILLVIQQRRRRAAERSLARQARQLQRSNYMLEQFAQVTAHDFQEPIRTVAVCTELLGRSIRGTLDAESERVLNYAVAGAQRMHSMVRSLVEWVRAADEIEGQGNCTDSAAVLNQALATRRKQIVDNNVSVTVHALPTISMQASHLLRIWEHLLDNALRYAKESTPRIDISAERRGHVWTFAVRDNGPGIPPAASERIFGVFKTLDRTNGTGMGMGLALCRRIIQHHGGRIWVESQPGRGATFYFSVPDTDGRERKQLAGYGG